MADMAQPASNAPPLLPAQQAPLDAVRVPRDSRPTYGHDVAAELRAEAEAALGGLVDAARGIDSRGMWVSKRDLAGVFGCEARHFAERDAPFEWSVPVARGIVLHKAVELSMHAQRSPAEATDDAIERLIETDENLGGFLAECSAGERADLVASCVALLTRFAETFPPIPRAWKPAAEVKARARLCDGAFTLGGKYDLTLGAPETVERDGGASRAGKVIVDLKTGSRQPTDPEDLRFYALIEALSVGVPPLGIGSFYVAEGRIEHEPVTTDVLASALRRTVDGITRYVELASGNRTPRRAPGPPCRWCPISDDCEPGQEWLADPDD